MDFCYFCSNKMVNVAVIDKSKVTKVTSNRSVCNYVNIRNDIFAIESLFDSIDLLPFIAKVYFIHNFFSRTDRRL